MWLPLTSRRCAAESSCSTSAANRPSHGPVAFTSTCAVAVVAAAAFVQHQPPVCAALGGATARVRADRGAMLGRIDGVEHDQAGIVGIAIGIFEPGDVAPRQRHAERVMSEV